MFPRFTTSRPCQSIIYKGIKCHSSQVFNSLRTWIANGLWYFYANCYIFYSHSTFQRKFYAYIFDPKISAFQKHPHFQCHKKFGFLCILYDGTQLFTHFCCVLFILTFKRLAVYFCVLCPHILRRSEAVSIQSGFRRKRQ